MVQGVGKVLVVVVAVVELVLVVVVVAVDDGSGANTCWIVTEAVDWVLVWKGVELVGLL